MHCEACRADAPRLTDAEVQELLPVVPEWRRVDVGGCPALERVFPFSTYAAAVTFNQQCAALAEAEKHHPRLVLEWGRVTVQWWTHKIKGLHRNDFIMAARTDRLEKG